MLIIIQIKYLYQWAAGHTSQYKLWKRSIKMRFWLQHTPTHPPTHPHTHTLHSAHIKHFIIVYPLMCNVYANGTQKYVSNRRLCIKEVNRLGPENLTTNFCRYFCASPLCVVIVVVVAVDGAHGSNRILRDAARSSVARRVVANE